MSSNKQRFIGILLSYVTIFVSFVVAFIYTPICIRNLGQSENGLLVFSTSIVSYLALLSFGLGSAYIRFLTREKRKSSENGERKINGIYLILFTLVGVIALITGMVLVSYSDNLFSFKYGPADLIIVKRLLFLLVIQTSLSFPLSIFEMYINANEKFIFSKSLTLLSKIISPFILIALLFLGYKSVALTLATFIITIFIYILEAVYSFHILKIKIAFKLTKDDLGLIKELLIFSSFIFLNTIVDQVNTQTDTIIIGLIISAEAVTIYNVGRQFSAYFVLLSTAISSVYTPKIHNLVEVGKIDEINEIFIKVARIQSFVMFLVFCGFLSLGKEFIYLWIGPGYEIAYYVLILLTIASIIPLTQNVGIEVQRAMNKHKFRAIVYIIIAVLNVSISIILCYSIGMIGCAIGTFIATTIGQGLLLNIYNYRVIKLDIPRYFRYFIKALISSAFSCLVILGLNLIFPDYSFLDFLIKGGVLVIVFVFLFLLVSISRDERKSIGASWKKLLKR